MTDTKDEAGLHDVMQLALDGQAAYEPILKHFRWAHLPPHLADVSKRFAGLAAWLVTNCPRSAERTVALRKLLEGKDAAVRAVLGGAD